MSRRKEEVFEIWSSLPYLPKDIQVSNLGRIRHWDNYFEIGTLIEPSFVDNQEKIYIKNRAYSVHRLVADAFLPNPNQLRFVLHKDKDHRNNRLTNLEWSSKSTRERKKRTASRKIYCPELNKVFCTLETISIVTRLPLNTITKAVKYNRQICGLTFKVLNNSDPILQDRDVIHITSDRFYDLAINSDSVEDCFSKIKEELGEEILVP